MRIETLNKMIGYILLIEELPRNKFTLFQEPYKNQSSDKADYPSWLWRLSSACVEISFGKEITLIAQAYQSDSSW